MIVPSWIQALAAVAIVFLTGWTLKVLREYAADTKQIAKTGVEQMRHAQQQIEHQQMPFLTIIKELESPMKRAGWYIQNQGFGPAINIMFSGDSHDGPVMKPTPPIKAGETRFLDYDIERSVTRFRRFEAEYESLSGLRYRTTINIGGNDKMETQFIKPE